MKWLETHKLVKYESEGRDADMDRIMESQAVDNHKDETEEKDEDPNEKAATQ